MTINERANQIVSQRAPWNKGTMIGAKPPLRPKHVWSIRTKLQVQERTRDLALFNLALDSKLRGCDVLALRIDDIASGGHSIDRATVRQRNPRTLRSNTERSSDESFRGFAGRQLSSRVQRSKRSTLGHDKEGDT
jgi:hypothetical protein